MTEYAAGIRQFADVYRTPVGGQELIRVGLAYEALQTESYVLMFYLVESCPSAAGLVVGCRCLQDWHQASKYRL
ncbi:hypothetical protein [Streptomyces qinglanensis]|uniref:hypothetical protein n=1 Tax=Streptomyces qinglanensis TaxID=943816 RepID=UPI0037B12085